MCRLPETEAHAQSLVDGARHSGEAGIARPCFSHSAAFLSLHAFVRSSCAPVRRGSRRGAVSHSGKGAPQPHRWPCDSVASCAVLLAGPRLEAAPVWVVQPLIVARPSLPLPANAGARKPRWVRGRAEKLLAAVVDDLEPWQLHPPPRFRFGMQAVATSACNRSHRRRLRA
ncbi:hypothetical protein MTO96_015837 [Rhipicephalus appendiculatus]